MFIGAFNVRKTLINACLLGAVFAFTTPTFAKHHHEQPVNNIVMPEPNPGTPVLNLIGRFSTLNYSEVGTFRVGSTQSLAVLKNKAYLGMHSPCFGSGRPGDKPGVLVLNVSDPANPQELGRLPFVAGVAPKNGSVGTVADIAKLKSGDILAINIGGAECIPIFGVEGVNGIELWDVSNPDITKAKLLSFTQVRDVNTIAATSGLNATVGSGINSVKLYRKGNKDYMAVTIGAGATESRANIGGLQIFDISNPSAPVRVGFWGPELIAYPGADLVNASPSTTPSLDTLQKYVRGEDPIAYGRDITNFPETRRVYETNVSSEGNGNLMYVGSGLGTLLLDISNPANIKHISTATNEEDSQKVLRTFGYAGQVTENQKVVVSAVNQSPFYLSMVIANAADYKVNVNEFGFTTKIGTIPGRAISSNDTKYVGLACTLASIPAPDYPSQIAVGQRGICAFSVKAQNLLDKGYAGFVLINSKATGDSPVGGTGTAVNIPGVGISYFAGLKVLGLTTDATHPCPNDTTNACLPNINNNDPLSDPNSQIGKLGSGVQIQSNKLQYGHLRVWDYSNKSNPKLLSTINTPCSIDPDSETCVVGSSQVLYPDTISDNKVYVIWGNQGLVVFDIKDPKNPKVIARYKINSDDFFNQNGGLQNTFTVDLGDNDKACIYSTDLNGGLYIYELPGKKCKKHKK